MKWYTGQVSENSEICFNTAHNGDNDLLHGYVSTHSNRETQTILARLQASRDIRIHAALDDIRFRVAQFDQSKSRQDLQVFMRYLESRLRDLNNKNAPILTDTNGQQRRTSKGSLTNGHARQSELPDAISVKSRASSTANVASRETPPVAPRQMGRQHHRSSGNIDGGGANGHEPSVPPRRPSQSSTNQGQCLQIIPRRSSNSFLPSRKPS